MNPLEIQPKQRRVSITRSPRRFIAPAFALGAGLRRAHCRRSRLPVIPIAGKEALRLSSKRTALPADR
jgi:hypothetical protein